MLIPPFQQPKPIKINFDQISDMLLKFSLGLFVDDRSYCQYILNSSVILKQYHEDHLSSF